MGDADDALLGLAPVPLPPLFPPLVDVVSADEGVDDADAAGTVLGDRVALAPLLGDRVALRDLDALTATAPLLFVRDTVRLADAPPACLDGDGDAEVTFLDGDGDAVVAFFDGDADAAGAFFDGDGDGAPAASPAGEGDADAAAAFFDGDGLGDVASLRGSSSILSITAAVSGCGAWIDTVTVDGCVELIWTKRDLPTRAGGISTQARFAFMESEQSFVLSCRRSPGTACERGVASAKLTEWLHSGQRAHLYDKVELSGIHIINNDRICVQE